MKITRNAAAIKDSGWILRKMQNVKLKPRLKEVVPGEEHQILRGMTKEVLRAKLTAVIALSTPWLVSRHYCPKVMW